MIKKYPHFGSTKGQGYMIYYKMGYIPQHFYKEIKSIVKRLISQEVSSRSLLPEKTSYTHERPEHPGEIWAEDFTSITIYGRKFYISLVIDVKNTYYLGATASTRADDSFVKKPVIQALEENDNKPPKQFLLSDHGTQYIGEKHEDLLDACGIIHKLIPVCVPQYNGSV